MKKLITILILSGLTSFSFASEIYVSASGKDTNSGTIESPVVTLNKALRIAREMRRLNTAGIENGIHIILKNGSYQLYEPLFIRPEDSGTSSSPTIIRSEKNNVSDDNHSGAVISGGIQIKNWKKSGKYWVATAPEFNGRPLEFRQLWINGKKAIRARDVEDFEKMNRITSVDKTNEVIWVPAGAINKILKANRAEMVLHQMWEISILRIKSIEIQGDSAAIRFHQPESRIQFERPWPRPMIAKGLNSAFYLTNAPELLDTPGEWYLDTDKKLVYYYPLKNEKIENLLVVAPALETLVNIAGTPDRPVQNIKFENVQFAYTNWCRPSVAGHVPLQAGMYLVDGYKLKPSIDRINNHKLDNQGWLGRPEAAVSVINASDISFENCYFEHLGSTGLDLISGVKNAKVEGSVFRDIAGNGLLTGSFSPSALETHLPYNPADLREVCSNQLISNNLFSDISNEEWGCVAIGAGYVSDIQIIHNEIYDVSYSAISVGWGWNRDLNCMKNNLIKANHIHHYARHMYDVAGIYTLGAQPGTLITENYIHSIYHPGYVHDPNHWFYLYTDEGSSFIRVVNNYTEGEKFLKNANGPGNVWENNGPMVNDSVKQNAGINLKVR
jgi:hypothetical protein